MNGTLLVTHFAVFFGAALTFRFRKGTGSRFLTVALGFVCVPLFGILTLALLDFKDHAGCGTTGAWYLIYSLLTFGILPVVSHACAAVSGDCAALAVRTFRRFRSRLAEARLAPGS